MSDPAEQAEPVSTFLFRRGFQRKYTPREQPIGWHRGICGVRLLKKLKECKSPREPGLEEKEFEEFSRD
jgi:hypothetical protein